MANVGKTAGTVLFLLLSGCGIQPQPMAEMGSGGQGALPHMSQSLTGISIYRPLGSPGVGAVDRNGGSTE